MNGRHVLLSYVIMQRPPALQFNPTVQIPEVADPYVEREGYEYIEGAGTYSSAEILGYGKAGLSLCQQLREKWARLTKSRIRLGH